MPAAEPRCAEFGQSSLVFHDLLATEGMLAPNLSHGIPTQVEDLEEEGASIEDLWG